MIAAVLDANVIVSGFPTARGAPAELIARWLAREFQVILSDHILRGVERAWDNPWFRDRYPRDEARRALALCRKRATFVVPGTDIRGVAPDEEDDLVLATAVAGHASYLVTGDRRLREIGHYGSFVICSPREFTLILDQAVTAPVVEHEPE